MAAVARSIVIAWIFSDPKVQETCRVIGADFHRQLGAQVDEEQHPDDGDHDAMVGQALYIGVEYRSPALALDAYNQWAAQSGYAPIMITCRVEFPNGASDWVLDIVTATVVVNRQYQITVLPKAQAPASAASAVVGVTG